MIIGIDLGTTNSLAAYFDETAQRLFPTVWENILTPSVVSEMNRMRCVWERRQGRGCPCIPIR